MKILLLQDIYEMRARKQQELEFYHRELEKLQIKMGHIRVEMDITNRIIDMIENERIMDFREYFSKKS